MCCRSNGRVKSPHHKEKGPPWIGGPFLHGAQAQQPAAFFRCDEGRNLRLFDALILIASPVRGLRPMRAPRFEVANVPKVPIWSRPPLRTPLRPDSMAVKTSSTARLASALLTLPCFATVWMKSDLLMSTLS